MIHKGKITISKPQCSSGDRYISITIKDDDSMINFLNVKMTLNDFADCITGLSYIDCNFEVYNLKNVGKKIETMPIEFEMPCILYGSNRNQEAIRLSKLHTPDGWICSEYFGSQNSFFTKDGKYYARTNASRWVDK